MKVTTEDMGGHCTALRIEVVPGIHMLVTHEDGISLPIPGQGAVVSVHAAGKRLASGQVLMVHIPEWVDHSQL